MSRSFRKNFKVSVCCESLRSHRDWKRISRKFRRHREKMQMHSDRDPDLELVGIIKYHKTKDCGVWSNPGDGYNFYPNLRNVPEFFKTHKVICK